jgi:hypothetical protein
VRAAAEKTLGLCSCQPSWFERGDDGRLAQSAGGCADDKPSDSVPPWCYVIPGTCRQPPQRRLGQPWDVCRGVRQRPILHAAFTCKSFKDGR